VEIVVECGGNGSLAFIMTGMGGFSACKSKSTPNIKKNLAYLRGIIL
jgi:hypothetical protein